jgi:hypothetical protein
MESFHKHFVEYKDFLSLKFFDLKPEDNLLNFIITLASSNPDSHIAVKAAYGISAPKFSFPIQPETVRVFGKYRNDKEVIDMKNVYSYYISQNESHLLNYEDVDLLCAKYTKAAGLMMTFFSDQHVWDFLTLYKLSKYMAFRRKFNNSFYSSKELKFHDSFYPSTYGRTWRTKTFK